MRDIVKRLLAAATAAVVVWWAAGGRADEAAEAAAVAGVNRLGWDLVRASGAGNAVVSPASVWEALAMTHVGAAGDTAAEIATVLGMPDDRGAIAAAARTLRQAFVDSKGETITIAIANRLWAQRGKRLEEPFVTTLEAGYGATAGLVDFAGGHEAARAEINGWVGDHTERKIPELLGAGSITPLTRLVLTNAVFMKAPWAEPFVESATQPAPFFVAPGRPVDVPFMRRSATLAAGRVGEAGAAATVCEIPYAGDRLAMVIVVPDEVDGLPDVCRGLTGDWPRTWRAEDGRVRRRPVTLALPKWTARKSLSLNAALQSLGMRKAFDGAADFSGIDGTRDLVVTDVVHEGFVDVGEAGTEAAAATGVVVGVRSMAPGREEPLVVKADRPFAWAVIDRQTAAVLFAGVVADPRG
jgi:serpin B